MHYVVYLRCSAVVVGAVRIRSRDGWEEEEEEEEICIFLFLCRYEVGRGRRKEGIRIKKGLSPPRSVAPRGMERERRGNKNKVFRGIIVFFAKLKKFMLK